HEVVVVTELLFLRGAGHRGGIERRRALHDRIAPPDEHLLDVTRCDMVLLVIDPRELGEPEAHGGGLGAGTAEQSPAEHADANRPGHAEERAAARNPGGDNVWDGWGSSGAG